MMASDAISFFRIGRDGLTAELRRSGRASKKLVAECGESVYCHPAVARAVASETQPKLHVGRSLGHHARTGSILIMTTGGVVRAAGFRRMIEESRWHVGSWNALRGLAWDVTKRGADAAAAEAIQAPRPQIVHLPLGPRWRHVTRADLRKYGVAIVCAACSVIAVHGKTSNLTPKNVGHGLASKWSMVLKVTNVCRLTDADEMWNLRLMWTGHRCRKRK